MKNPSKGSKFLSDSPSSRTPATQPSTKWSAFIDINKTNIKFTHQQSPPAKVKKYERTKTHLKCYQKPNRKIIGGFLQQKIESIKPVAFNCKFYCDSYLEKQENQFIISSVDKKIPSITQDIDGDNERNRLLSFHSPCIGLINPMYINVKSNPKRLTHSCQLPKDKELSQNEFYQQKFQRNFSSLHQTQNQSKIHRSSPNKQLKNSQNLYFRIVSEMNDYFSLMKLASFKNNKTQLLSKKNIRAQSQKKNLQESKMSPQLWKRQKMKSETEEDNLNIVGLRPKTTSDYQRIDRKLMSNCQIRRTDSVKRQEKQSIFNSKFYESQQFGSIRNNQKQFYRNQSQQKKYEFNLGDNINSVVINNDIFSRSPLNHHYRQQKLRSSTRPITQQIRKISPQKGIKKIVFKGYCFGEFNLAKISQEEIHRLKVLYYKDLLWKNNWNLCVKYLPSNQGLKYYVGKGNNSKLIKNLMTKRWWWSLESKEENSQFVWTQLKIYSIYEKQPNLSNQKETKEDQLSVHIQSPSKKKLEENEQKYLFLDNSALILSPEKKKRWNSYISQPQNIEREKKITQQTLQQKRKTILQIKISSLPNPSKITNHLEFSRAIGNKKALYKVMMTYFDLIKKYTMDEIYVPLTYHITAGLEDEEYLKFLSEYYRRSKSQGKTCWIVKPGELTNRGNGIRYCKDLAQIKPIVKKKETHPNGTLKTFLIQSYIDRPLLYKGRKFDIRHYIMISSINGKLRGYFYQGGYIRTTSYKYRLDDNSPAVHLTNDAVQKYCKDYGRYEKGNKLSYQEFDEYMKQKYTQNNGEKCTEKSQNQQKKISFFDTILPQIRQISTDVIHAAYYFIDPSRRSCNFEIFGLDIMIDEALKCYLIEVNTNPCLQLSSPVLRSVIPQMLDNALSLTLDCCYPPPQKEPMSQYHKKYKYPQSPENKFEIVFDQDIHGPQIKRIYQNQGMLENEISGIGDDDENFQSCDQDNEDY